MVCTAVAEPTREPLTAHGLAYISLPFEWALHADWHLREAPPRVRSCLPATRLTVLIGATCAYFGGVATQREAHPLWWRWPRRSESASVFGEYRGPTSAQPARASLCPSFGGAEEGAKHPDCCVN